MFKLKQLLRSLAVRLHRLFLAGQLKSIGRNVYVFPGGTIERAECISLGDNVIVLDGTVLSVHPSVLGDDHHGISIGSGSNIGRRNHIYAMNKIIIGEKVLTASNVYISDCTHEFTNPDLPVIDQPIKALKPVTIGDGTWIGHGSSVIGCMVGRNCVIGANSVVLRDVADYSVVAGVPAKLIRTYDPAAQRWIRHDQSLAEKQP